MNIQITGIHLEVTDTIREYVDKKISKVTKNTDNIISIAAILSVEKLLQKAEINVEIAGKKLHVEAAENDLYAAIDAVTDKLSRALIKHKEIQTNHRHVPSGREVIAEPEEE